MKSKWLVVVLLLVTLSGIPLWAQQRIDVTEVGVLVPVEVNGKSTLLLLDTGARYTHLDAKRLGIRYKTGKHFTILTGNGSIDMPIIGEVQLSVSGHTFALDALDLDLSMLRRECKCDVAGVLPIGVLRQFESVLLDFKTSTLTLYKTGKQSEAAKKVAGSGVQ